MRDVTCEESRQQYNFIINQVSDASDNGRWTMAQNKFSGSDIFDIVLCCILTIIDWSILIKEQRALYFVIEEEHQITLAANAYNKYK